MITSLSKKRADDAKHKILTCEADGVPEPSFQWSVNGTDVSVRACLRVRLWLISLDFAFLLRNKKVSLLPLVICLGLSLSKGFLADAKQKTASLGAAERASPIRYQSPEKISLVIKFQGVFETVDKFVLEIISDG